MKRISILALFMSFLSTQGLAHQHNVIDNGQITGEETTCFPQTNEERPINHSFNGFTLSGVSEKEFDDALDKVEKVYRPIFKKKKLKLKVKRKWKNNTVNASARPGILFKHHRIINMYGGLARHETITVDAFTLVACHEIGHHIGGVPKINRKWASNEGQADYFASLKCLRKVFAEDDNIAIVSQMNVPELAQEKCNANFSDPQEAAICMRSTMAGYSVANLFKALRRSSDAISITTPDTTIVTATTNKHPATQCRLDTYYQGAICHVNKSIDVSNSSEDTGACTRRLGDIDGVRPLCWFGPKEVNLNLATN